jgi:hypothetical protein
MSITMRAVDRGSISKNSRPKTMGAAGMAVLLPCYQGLQIQATSSTKQNVVR